MQYNIHPLFVHFPIAFLCLYSVIKILPLARWFPNIAWKQIERTLLVVGVLGAFLSSSTGEAAEHLTNPDEALVEMHALFASLSTWLYGVLLVGEALAVLNKILIPKLSIPQLAKLTNGLEKLLCHPVLSRIVAIAGLLAISVTGLLGGVMVYGTSADPVAPFVLRLLGLRI